MIQIYLCRALATVLLDISEWWLKRTRAMVERANRLEDKLKHFAEQGGSDATS